MSYCGEGVGRGRGRQGRREARDQKMYTADWLEVGCFWVSPPSPLTASPPPRGPAGDLHIHRHPCGFGAGRWGTPFVILLGGRSFSLAPGAHLDLLHLSAGGRGRGHSGLGGSGDAWREKQGRGTSLALALPCTVGWRRSPSISPPSTHPSPAGFRAAKWALELSGATGNEVWLQTTALGGQISC